jgi:putative addiction module component (TIGR02574 family)
MQAVYCTHNARSKRTAEEGSGAEHGRSAQLVDSLLESLEERHEDSAAVEAAWNDEIARRIAELDSGKAKTIAWEEVRQRISAKLTKGR